MWDTAGCAASTPSSSSCEEAERERRMMAIIAYDNNTEEAEWIDEEYLDMTVRFITLFHGIYFMCKFRYCIIHLYSPKW